MRSSVQDALPRACLNARPRGLTYARLFLPALKLAKMEASLNVRDELFGVCVRRGIPVTEPFAGHQIGFLTVCGPSQAYYEELVPQFSDTETLNALDATDQEDRAIFALSILASGAGETSLDDNPRSTPENDSSVISRDGMGRNEIPFHRRRWSTSVAARGVGV
jgi:hypothetical protein